MKKIFTLVIMSVFVLSGCATSGQENVYTYPTKKIEGLDVVRASYSQTFQLFEDVFSGLYRVNNQGEIIPELALDMPQISEDQLTYTIKLRQDAKWYDNNGEVAVDEIGNEINVTADDFVYSYQRMLDPSVGGTYGYVFDPIVNASEIMAGEKPITDLGVRAVDEYTLEIKLKNPTPYFTSMLAFQAFYPESKHAVLKYGEDYGITETSTYFNGPFYVSYYDLSYNIRAQKNENYYNADQVELDAVDYRTLEDSSGKYNAYLSGQIDFSEYPTPEEYEKGVEDGTSTDWQTGYMFYAALNQNTAFENENLRKAISYGFDREGIVNAIYGEKNTPVNYFVPSEFTNSAYNGIDYADYRQEGFISYDVEKANEYLDIYMQQEGISSASEIEFDILHVDAEENRKIAQAVQDSLQRNLGIKINLVTQPSTTFYESTENGDFDMAIMGWGADYADPSSYLAILHSSQANGGLNYGNYQSETYDELYKLANDETDPIKRMELFSKAEYQAVVSDAAMVPIYQKNDAYAESEDFETTHLLFPKVSNMYTKVTK